MVDHGRKETQGFGFQTMGKQEQCGTHLDQPVRDNSSTWESYWGEDLLRISQQLRNVVAIWSTSDVKSTNYTRTRKYVPVKIGAMTAVRSNTV